MREEYGYTGGYTQVREHVREARARKCAHLRCASAQSKIAPSMPQAAGARWRPDGRLGEAQIDWGEAYVYEGAERRKIYMFVMALPCSDARFVAAFPRCTLEFFLEGVRSEASL